MPHLRIQDVGSFSQALVPDAPLNKEEKEREAQKTKKCAYNLSLEN